MSFANHDESFQNSPLFFVGNVSSSAAVDQEQSNVEVATNVIDETSAGPKFTETERLSSVQETKTSSIGKKRKRNSTLSNAKSNSNDSVINFRISSLHIGSWKWKAKHDEELIARFYFKTRKLAWEILDDNNKRLKFKFEIPFSDIDVISKTSLPHQSGRLCVRLKNPPIFFGETDPKPRKHTKWVECRDFTTNQAATKTRIHLLEFDQGVLEKHYTKIMKDSELSKVGRLEFPFHESPLFDDVHYHELNGTNNMNSQSSLSEFPLNLGLPQLTLPGVPMQECRTDGTPVPSPPRIASSDYNPINYASDRYPPFASAVTDYQNQHDISSNANQYHPVGNYAVDNPLHHNYQFAPDHGRQFGNSNHDLPGSITPSTSPPWSRLQDPRSPTLPPGLLNKVNLPSLPNVHVFRMNECSVRPSHQYQQFNTSTLPFLNNGHMMTFPAQAHGRRNAVTNGDVRRLPIRHSQQKGYDDSNRGQFQTAVDYDGVNQVNRRL